MIHVKFFSADYTDKHLAIWANYPTYTETIKEKKKDHILPMNTLRFQRNIKHNILFF